MVARTTLRYATGRMCAAPPEIPDWRARLAASRAPLRRAIERLEQAAERSDGPGGGTPELATHVGLELGRAHAAAIDQLLCAAFAQALSATGFEPRDLALCAVGSYGRGALALGADVDVRLLTRDPRAAEPVVRALLYPLWDAGLSLGHQAETVDELLCAAADDLPTATSLLDCRHLGGDAGLWQALSARASAELFSPAGLPRFVARLEAEVAQRHGRFGGSVYLLEPDVKNGPGGMRDLDVAGWAARGCWGVQGIDGLLRRGVVGEREIRAVGRARELEWRIRNLLHAAAGRRSDRLGFDQQESVARLLGYGREPREAAERLMSDYYRAARTIGRFRDALLTAVLPVLGRGRPPRVRRLGAGVQLFGEAVTVTNRELLDRDPSLAWRVVRAALDQRLPLEPHLRSALMQRSEDPSWAERLRTAHGSARAFVELVIDCRDTRLRAGSIVRELHDLGLLVAMIPELAPLVGRVHYDVYHVYTVDVHSVAAVDRLGELVRGELVAEQPEGGGWGAELPSRLAREIGRPAVLFLATLLHDVGKAIGRHDHAARGAALTRTILTRLGFAAEDVDEACRLVASHLLMYHLATRRDIDDPAVVAELVRQVGDAEGLRALYLLTVADVSTTSPSSMTWWKAHMLEQLFLVANRRLRGMAGVDSVRMAGRRAAVLQAARAAVGTEGRGAEHRMAEAASFVDSMPPRYLLTTPAPAVAAHAELARLQVATGVEASVGTVASDRPDVAELCVVAADRPGLLAAITAVLSAARLDVHSAEIHSRGTASGGGAGAGLQAVDLFWVRDPSARPGGVVELGPRIERDLRAVLRGDLEPRNLVRVGRRSGRGEAAIPTRVVLDDRASPEHTVVEVFAHDRPGLLSTLAAALHGLGLTIDLAKIGTEGVRVIDVFYVREKDGKKVCLEQRATELRTALLEAVARMDAKWEEA